MYCAHLASPLNRGNRSWPVAVRQTSTMRPSIGWVMPVWPMSSPHPPLPVKPLVRFMSASPPASWFIAGTIWLGPSSIEASDR